MNCKLWRIFYLDPNGVKVIEGFDTEYLAHEWMRDLVGPYIAGIYTVEPYYLYL